MPSKNSIEEPLAQELFTKASSYTTDSSLAKLKRAYEFAHKAHEGQLRKSGEPYIIHPLRTAHILTRFHSDEDTLAAALLHDVPEDTNIPLHEIERRFGKKIAYLVDGITKLSKMHYREEMRQRQIESLKKLFIHSAQDLRVILIKLADRLDNMRTLYFIADSHKRARIAKETQEIYVPIANLLGVGEIRGELEDLCFEHLNPAEYQKLKADLEQTVSERTFVLSEMIRVVEKELKKEHLEAEIIGRPKTLASTYRKLQTHNALANVEDLIAIRVIVPSRQECYTLLGLIHKIFKPKSGRVKDYIALPKPNGYQSIHTTVFGINGSPVEFQIRTRYMHLEAEYGIAAHYFYKYGDEEELASIIKQRSSWVQRILELQKTNSDPERFIEHLKLDVFQDRIFVFSPKGDVIDLPHGACALDFAYAIHTDIGSHAVRSEINGVMMPVTAELKTGDTVNIIMKRSARPQREWLNFVKTTRAMEKIKEYLRRQPVALKREIGRQFLQKEFDRIGKNFVEELTDRRMRKIREKLRYGRLDALLIAVGEGELDPQRILEIIYNEEQLTPGSRRYTILRRSVSNGGGAPAHVQLWVMGKNDRGQFREITRHLNVLGIPISRYRIDRPWYLSTDRCVITVEVKNYNELSQVFETLEQLEGVEKVSRRFFGRTARFLTVAIITGVLWLLHPFLVDLAMIPPYANIVPSFAIYAGLGLLFGLVIFLKKNISHSFPGLYDMMYFWPLLYGLTTLALFVTIGEVLTFHLEYNWIFVLALIAAIYGYLTNSYLKYRKRTNR